MAFLQKLAFILSISTLGIALPSNALNQQIFYDGFEGDFNQQWIVSNGYANGTPFGCSWAYSEVWKTLSDTNGILNVNLNGSNKLCGEIRSRKQFRYGSFVTNMKPLNVPGTISSFFLYTGPDGGGKPDHFEIDIEFIGGTNKLHTNYWIRGQQYPLDIDIQKKFGINPYTKMRRYGFEWRANKITWFLYDDAGNKRQLRQVQTTLDATMPIFMNNWNGDNSPNAIKYFPGAYNSGGGPAQYDYVWVGD